MLKQVVLNILDNALKFSPSGGSVSITAWYLEEGEPTVSLGITDSGIGIRLEHLNRIFEPLEQIKDPQAGRYSGAGLGMALARRYVELHHGVLNVYSQGTARGSTFVISLPLGRLP